MKRTGSVFLLLLTLLAPLAASAQIDPVKRDLIQIGYNAAFEGRQPFSGYAFYYHNQPNFLKNTNLTLRLAVAPTYVDSELGILNGLGNDTDIGIGAAGGAFADSYNEIRGGTFIPSESFDGYGGEMSFSLYHLVDPGRMIPLSLVFRLTPHYSAYGRDNTASDFALPADHLDGSVRTGMRFGGVEPTLFPALAMELSVWYEGHFRSSPGYYGFASNPYHLNIQSHLFWGEAALSYTFNGSGQNVYLRLTAGTSVDADRFSAYRLGSFLPLIAEFPLSLPGYFYQEISARQFVLLNANYVLPIDKKHRWDLVFNASTAAVDYLPGAGQPGSWLSGVSGGLMWHSPTDRWKIMTDYAYGINAIRDNHRGANSIGVLVQLDLGKPGHVFSVTQPSLWQGIQRLLP
ncbi:MAG TPA: hypothetical protein VH280_05115 [Verrucomicrobiae bacterium]|jgi:hypothetical protein|nr:hypothetical protein [Verrucomicrobiae bacterium]